MAKSDWSKQTQLSNTSHYVAYYYEGGILMHDTRQDSGLLLMSREFLFLKTSNKTIKSKK
jgi:hypothetical protein